MSLLLVFFPEDNTTTTTTTIANKTKLLSSSSSPTSSPSSSSKRTYSNASGLLFKAQSTISIWALLLFITLLLFTLSTFEPTIPTTTTTNPLPRRFLLQKPPPTAKPKTQHWLPKLWLHKPHNNSSSGYHFPSTALQRMGTLYRRGTRAMNDLVVGHVVEDTTEEELMLFLRVLHRSGITSKSDVVFVFASPSMISSFAAIVREENDSFLSLVELHTEFNSARWSQEPESSFDVTRFFQVPKKRAEMREPLWGKRIRSNLSNPEAEAGEGDLTRLSYGSVLSFDVSELDPGNSLAGF